jgi:hypothetical protein
MSSPIRWRPLAEFDLDNARTLVEQATVQWQRNWFGTRVPSAISIEPLRVTRRAELNDIHFDSVLTHNGLSLRWSVSSGAARLLACKVLDVKTPVAARPGTEGAAALTHLGERIANELSDALKAAFRGSAGFGAPDHPAPLTGAQDDTPDDGVLVRLASPCGAELCLIFCSAALLRDRFTAPPPTRPRAPVEVVTRHHALRSTDVRVFARLGYAELPLHQLLDLSPGDVIAIDRKLDDPVGLFVGSDGTAAAHPFASGHLGHTGARLSIQLDSSIVQDNA